jgi:hypothetical protein
MIDAAPAETVAVDKFERVRSDITNEIRSKLRLARIIYLPQLILMAIICVALTLVTGWGIWASVGHLEKPDINDLKSLVGYLTTGSSGFLGAVLLPLFKRIGDMSHGYLHLETKFSQALSQALHADTKAQIINATKLMSSG